MRLFVRTLHVGGSTLPRQRSPSYLHAQLGDGQKEARDMGIYLMLVRSIIQRDIRMGFQEGNSLAQEATMEQGLGGLWIHIGFSGAHPSARKHDAGSVIWEGRELGPGPKTPYLCVVSGLVTFR
jgi:hypothetical protein